VSTATFGLVSIILYVIMNYLSHGNVIVDSVTALGIWIAFYYGLTGLACFVYYRKTLTESAHNLWMRGILPLLGWAIMWAIGGYSFVLDWGPGSSDTHWRVPGVHWVIGGAFVLALGSVLVGIILYFTYKAIAPAYFRGEVLNRDTTTTIPEDLGEAVGLFGIEEQPAPAPNPSA
jgi:hypothetical protein